MKKIAIVTIDSTNYGNKLQNYALQKFIEGEGFECETLLRNRYNMLSKSRRLVKSIIQCLIKTKGSKYNKFRKLIHWSRYVASDTYISTNINNKFDYFIAGSDQLWNPEYPFVCSVDFLDFAPKEKSISYAASFGVSIIPQNKKEEYSRYLRNIKSISVRETEGSEIVYELTKKEAPVMPDPTLLIDKDEWRKISVKPINMKKGKYVFTYFLSEDCQVKNKILELAKEKGCYIFDILEVGKNGRQLPLGPAEFLYLIDHAEYVFTDSFHCSVFSIIFHKEFRVIERTDQKIGSRIENLLNVFSLQKAMENTTGTIMDEDTEKRVEDTLVYQKNKAKKFIQNSTRSGNKL